MQTDTVRGMAKRDMETRAEWQGARGWGASRAVGKPGENDVEEIL